MTTRPQHSHLRTHRMAWRVIVGGIAAAALAVGVAACGTAAGTKATGEVTEGETDLELDFAADRVGQVRGRGQRGLVGQRLPIQRDRPISRRLLAAVPPPREQKRFAAVLICGSCGGHRGGRPA
jgi:hypothetical protein